MQKLLYILILTFGLTACLKDKGFEVNHKPLFKNSQVELSGTTTGYGVLRTDGVADFGLVLKSFNKTELFQIKLDDLMSESIDRISVFGRSLDIPSNVAIPQQSERYFITIRLNKPTYRVYFEPMKDTSIIILHGQFPFSDVIDGFQNDQSLLELAGLFDILSYSEYPGSVFDTAQTVSQDLDVGQTPLFNKQLVIAPKTIPRDFNFVAVSLLTNLNGMSYFPTDIKVVSQARSANIKVDHIDTPMFSGLFHNTFAEAGSTNPLKYKMSLQFHNKVSENSAHLGFVENLSYQNQTLSYTPPLLTAISTGEVPTAIGKVIRVFKTHNSNGSILTAEELVFTQVTVGSWGSAQEVLTDFTTLQEPGAKYRIEISLLANTSGQVPTTENELYEMANLVTKNVLML